MIFIGMSGGGAPPKVWGGAAGCGADGSGQGCWQRRQLQGFWLRGAADGSGSELLAGASPMVQIRGAGRGTAGDSGFGALAEARR